MSQELLASMPINIGNFNSATSLLNYAPGVNGSSAFGGDSSYGNSLLIDGVDTRDPEGGSAWVFFNFNIVEEVQVGGIGAAAEYGGFSGAVVNTITKSGGNMYSGLFEARHTNDGLASDNIPEDALELNPALGNTNVLTKLNDYTVQLGGPLAQGQGVLVGQRPALRVRAGSGWIANDPHRGEPQVQRQAHVPGHAQRHADRQLPVRQLQRHGPARVPG